MDHFVLVAIFLPLIVSPLFFAYRGKGEGLLFSLVAAISFGCLLGVRGEGQILSFPWVPSLGVHLSFLIDHLSLFFGLLASGMGVLVGIYSHFYMKEEEKLRSFYFSLTFFMGTMLGAVFSNDLLLLFTFWELTGVSSFLLIGYYNPAKEALQGARLSFLVTCLTSLALLVGIVILAMLTGTLEISELKVDPRNPWTTVAVVCFLLGIFGKSAQFPFYFWLPNAMAAPTPVSAYLHAATMVKLGIFLTARMYQFFVLSWIWFPALTVICFGTMVAAALASLLANDLKEILAYATVSQLGFFLGFYGLGGEAGIEYDLLHIFNHALYKGSLFMLVGIVDAATGIRDIRRLGGLGKLLPLTTIIFFIAACAMAGVPGTTGFLSKELIFEELSIFEQAKTTGSIIFFALVVSLIFKVAFSFRLFYHLFVRTEGFEPVEKVEPPGFFVQLSPLILSSLALLFGVYPDALEVFLSYLEATDLPQAGSEAYFLSVGIFAIGIFLFFLLEHSGIWLHNLETKLNLGAPVGRFFDSLPSYSGRIVPWVVPASRQGQLYLLFLFYGIAMALGIQWQAESKNVFFTLITIPVIFTTGGILFVKRDLQRIILFAASGFFLTLFYLLLRQTDLALTQILVDVVTLMLLLYLMADEKRSSPLPFSWTRGALSFLVAAAGSLLFVSISYQKEVGEIGRYYIANSLPLAKGANAVNTILVDFRGLDTLGEITVLFLAAQGIYLLFPRRENGRVVAPIGSDLFATIAPLIFLLASLLAIYLLLKGHNSPGGGFIGGLCLAIGLILILMSRTVQGRLGSNFNMLQVALLGLLVVYSVVLLPVGKILQNPPLYFDIGIFLVVVGVSVRIVRRLRDEVYGEVP